MHITYEERDKKLYFFQHRKPLKISNLARHYKEKIHSLKFIGVEKVRPNPRVGNLINQLLRREVFWIYEFNTIEPYGQNEMLDL